MQARWSAEPRSFGKCEHAGTIRFLQTRAWCGWCRWCMYCVQRQNRKCFVRVLDTGTYHHLLCACAWITITDAQADSEIAVSSVVGWTCQSPSWCCYESVHRPPQEVLCLCRTYMWVCLALDDQSDEAHRVSWSSKSKSQWLSWGRMQANLFFPHQWPEWIHFFDLYTHFDFFVS